MAWDIKIKSKEAKKAKLLETRFKIALKRLIDDLADNGPIRNNWPNYGVLLPKSNNEHHCHLIKRSSPCFVVCWRVESEETKYEDGEIKVYYIGSHENVPY